MPFTLTGALPFLRCPVSGEPLADSGDALVTPDGRSYPIVDGIADLVVQRQAPTEADYDGIAGLRYNLFIFNPLTMAFTWGPQVLSVPLRVQPSKALGDGLYLDVPCGTGIFTARAYRRRRGARILAVDYSMGMLRAARQRAQRHGVDNAVFLRADVARLPLASSAIDGCLSLAGFHAFPEPQAAARELSRVLKPGGRATATIACSGVRRVSDMMIDRVMKPLGYFRQGLTPSTYRDIFETAGFTEVEVTMAGAVAIVRAARP